MCKFHKSKIGFNFQFRVVMLILDSSARFTKGFSIRWLCHASIRDGIQLIEDTKASKFNLWFLKKSEFYGI
jgi:hypothetical protein